MRPIACVGMLSMAALAACSSDPLPTADAPGSNADASLDASAGDTNGDESMPIEASDAGVDAVGDGDAADGSDAAGCPEGAACVPSNPCFEGYVACPDGLGGSGVCEANGLLAPGSSCGGGKSCDAVGMCGGCPAGAACTATDPCRQGVVSCGSGSAACSDGSIRAAGAPCGAGNVCDATGSCATCVAVTGYRQVSAGNGYSCAIDASSGVVCWGLNDYGQLGDGTRASRPTPAPVTGLGSGVATVAAGASHACALTTGGAVRCWGHNMGGLGDGTAVDRFTPVDVVGLASGVARIAAGDDVTCAITVAGALKCWGLNMFGQLGDGSAAPQRHVPGDVTGLTSGVVAVAVRGQSSFAVTSAGALKAWGNNTYGQLGDGGFAERRTPVDVTAVTGTFSSVAAGGFGGCGLTTTGAVRCWGGLAGALTGEVVSGASAVAMSLDHACALTTTGGVKCWGGGGVGQLGVGATDFSTTAVDAAGLTSGVVGITAGGDHTCALTSNGGVRCWGSDADGQLGDGAVDDAGFPVEVAGAPTGLLGVAAGVERSFLITSSGAVKGWGNDREGQLGDGSVAARRGLVDVVGLSSGVVAVAPSLSVSCALGAAGWVKCWGTNEAGEVGDGTTQPRPTPTDVVGLGSGVVALHCGSQAHCCAVTSIGEVKCWGRNTWGQVTSIAGTDVTTPVAVPVTGATAVALGAEHSCALVAGGAVQCWGLNSYGQLGGVAVDGSSERLPIQTPIASGATAVASGGAHSCALVGGRVLCWGANTVGQLGSGWGYRPSPWEPVEVFGLSSISAIALGGDVSCALTAAGGVKCWGANARGQTGDGGGGDRYVPVDVFGLASGIAQLSVGGHVCALTTAGAARCWGPGHYGESTGVIAWAARSVCD